MPFRNEQMKHRGKSGSKDRMQCLREAMVEIDIESFFSYRDLLDCLYLATKDRLGAYSYYKYAKDLGLSESNVIWLVITGRRKLSDTIAEKIAHALHMTGNTRRFFLTLVGYNNATRPDVREGLLSELLALKSQSLPDVRAKKNVEYYSAWQHPIIREVLGVDNISQDPADLAEMLSVPITRKEVEESLEFLTKLGLIRQGSDGKFEVTNEQVLPDQNVEALTAITFHQKMCDIAKDAVSRVAAKEREFNTLTVAISEEDAMEISSMMYDVCKRIFEMDRKTKKRERLYQINMQLFPLTKKKV